MYTFLSAYIYPFNCAGTAPCAGTHHGVLLPSVAWQNIEAIRSTTTTTPREIHHHASPQPQPAGRPASQPASGFGRDVHLSPMVGPFVRSRVYRCRPQIMCDYPLNLSILIRGGKETNKDSASSCERKRKSSARRGDATVRCLPGSVYWKFCHPPCPAQCPSSTRMWLLLPQRVIGP